MAVGTIRSYAPAPTKIGSPATFSLAASLTSASASCSESVGGRSSSPSNLGETSAKRSSKESTPMAPSISSTSASVCGVNRATRLYPLFSGGRYALAVLSQNLRVLPRRRRSALRWDRTFQDALRRAVLLPERFGPSPRGPFTFGGHPLPGGSLPRPSSDGVSLAHALARCGRYDPEVILAASSHHPT